MCLNDQSHLLSIMVFSELRVNIPLTEMPTSQTDFYAHRHKRKDLPPPPPWKNGNRLLSTIFFSSEKTDYAEQNLKKASGGWILTLLNSVTNFIFMCRRIWMSVVYTRSYRQIYRQTSHFMYRYVYYIC